MFQPGSRQGARAILPFLRAGGLWLIHMGLFAGLLWLSAQLPWKAPAVVVPELTAPATPPSPFAEPPPKPVLAERQLLTPDAPDPFPDPSCYRPGGSDVIPFDATMTRPELISGETLQYTPEALAAGVRGLIIARCTITCHGEVKACRLIKSLPHMEQATLAMLESRRYRPARYLGMPLSVTYAFNIKLALP